MEIRENTTFWAELKAYRICIPDYQRDYAQGRKDGGRIDNIREVFVEQMYNACTTGSSYVCHLGLVFGSYDKKENKFIAVDGQQRLTSVFLLHWYLLWKEDKLKDYKEVLSNFVWNTRSYSSQFASLLINLNKAVDKGVIPTIKEHKDYFKVWEKDPSVKAMMNSLAEIEKQYVPSANFELLLGEECRIKYDILPLSANSDGKTYLKMNSRGRSLTTYENFKAKFQDVVSALYPSKKEDPSFESLSISFDGKWLNFMLEQAKDSSGNSFSDPDIPFMYYINEYTIGQLCSKGKIDEIEPLVKAKIDKNGNLRDVPFVSFESYRPAFENIEEVEAFRKGFDWIIKHFGTIASIDKKCRYGNDYFMANILSNKPDYGDRAKFYALLRYAILSEYSEIEPGDIRLKRWARIFTNLIENTVIVKDNIDRIISAIDSVSTPDILSFLSSSDLPAFNREQVREEIAKAKQILDKDGKLRKYVGPHKKKDGSDYSTWEEIIIEAEKYAFFKGAIRFLFTNENGDVNDKSWGYFDAKWANVQSCFKSSPDVKLLKSLISHFNKWEDFKQIYYDNNESHWRGNLLNSELQNSVHHFLMEYNTLNIDSYQSHISDDEVNFIQNKLIKTNLLENIPNKDYYMEDGRNLHRYYICRDSDIYFWNPHKNKLLSDSSIECTRRIADDCNFFYGKNINFKFHDHFFQWWGSPNEIKLDVYLMENDWVDFKKRVNPTSDKGTDEDKYFCFRVNGADFIESLNKLINDSEKNT